MSYLARLHLVFLKEFCQGQQRSEVSSTLQNIKSVGYQYLATQFFFPVKNVANFSMPIPGSWSAVSSAGKRGMQEVYVHNGEEFVAMKGANDRPYYIRWTDVSIYEPQASTGRLVT